MKNNLLRCLNVISYKLLLILYKITVILNLFQIFDPVFTPIYVKIFGCLRRNMRVRRPIDTRLLALLCVSSVLLPASACPTQCTCKWKNGKRYVECIDKDLKSIPDTLDGETQVLEFSGNDLQVLQKETFHKLGLLNLQKIFIPRCKIQKVDNHAFKGLTNLVELDLSENYLTIVPSSNFIYFPTLMRLSLNNNPITFIKSNCFQHLTYLTTLELSNCKIDLIENDAFSGLNHIEWLRLDGNKLPNIQGNNILPDTLRGIELQNNNWNCDCNLNDLHKWLLNFNRPHTIEPVCSSPERLRERKILSLSNIELACLPQLSPTSVYLETNEGGNITLECLVKAIPEAKVSWWFQGRIVQNDSLISPGFRILYYLEEGTINKKSELYILNIDNDDNGTYSCVAENPAGKSQANYTIRIIVKEEPVIIVVTFPQKHIIIIITGVFLIIVLVLLIISVVLLKFKADTKTRKKTESSKDVALRNRNLPTLRDTTHTLDTLQPKSNGSLIINAQTHHVLHYTVQGNRNFDSSEIFPVGTLKNFSERNPDLINDAESVVNNIQNENNTLTVYNNVNVIPESFQEETSFSAPPTRQVTWQDQQQPVNVTNVSTNNMNSLYQHSVDVHLNPGCFLDSDGYPYDYGLPKVSCRSTVHPSFGHGGPYYQTLPHNRPKGQKLSCKFAKDTEFNTSVCPNAESFNSSNIRHTLEGYPYSRNRQQIAFVGNGTLFYNDTNFVPSPPEGYKSEPVPTQCCGGPIVESCTPWVNTKGTCAVMVPVGIAESGVGRCYHVETRCVDTQTTEARLPNDSVDNCLKPNPLVSNTKNEPEICSESPDEGYVGDGVDSADI